MAYHNNPRIVTDGLVLCLDANAKRSYPGTGTTWYDLLDTSNTGTIVGATYNSNGYFTYDGTNDWSYINSPGSYNDYSFMMFVNVLTSTQYTSRFFGLNNYGTYTLYNPSNVGFHFNPDSNTSSSSSVTIGSGVNVGFGNWFHVCVTSRKSSGVYESKVYINGDLEATSGLVPSSTFHGQINIGAQRTPDSQGPSNCHIGNFLLYNKVLAASEISTIYNAHKSRFGL
tara:strand:+ start:13 stop:693 length:681 start_codon:yes stop_codon:yes gene_type:complete